MKEILNIKNLKIYFASSKGPIKSLNGVDLTLKEGQTLGLVGESGCGKSLTSLAIMGLLDKKSLDSLEGEIIFSGENLLEKSEKQIEKIRGKDISMIFQEPMTSLNPVLKIGYQVSEIYRAHSNISRKEAKEKSIEMLEKVELNNAKLIYDSYPHELSGGMRQRVMIAMALAPNPKILIADEPTTALDVTIQKEILELMKKLKKYYKTSLIFISHDLSLVAEIADVVNVMYQGLIVEEAPVKEIFKNPLHPYTKGLMKARPLISDTRKRLFSIKGSLQDPRNLNGNCYFCNRCQYVMDICKRKIPIQKDFNGHKVRCFLYE